MRVVVFNVFYPPLAFGGATIVAEQTTTRMASLGDDTYLVVTLDPRSNESEGGFTRYTSVLNSVEVIAVTGGNHFSYVEGYRGDSFVPKLDLIIESFKPDVALVHCIQGMGARIIERLKEQNIPVALFVHDAWWICERQFMVTREGAYCHQMPVNPLNCRNCIETLENTTKRSAYLLMCLRLVDKIIYPSTFFLKLYVASGAPSNSSVVVKNGVTPPVQLKNIKKVRNEHTVRFGYVGGVGPMKGSHLIQSVFKEFNRNDYELVCVDNLGNLGKSTPEFSEWRVTGSFRTRAAYTQDTIDEFFNEIDVLLLPSQCKESFGLVAREALIRDKWVISTDSGGTIEDIIDGVNGRVIPLGQDTSFFKEAIIETFSFDWSSYENPYATNIHTFDDQASELRSILIDVSQG